MLNSRNSLVSRPLPARTVPTSAQVCPVCGGLECLCRPRFFSGQLLSEEDLNRLDRYITAKNRLHNRMLFGWGVVNGLEVICGPCNNEVIVRAGYALSPCGDDIVVCKDTPVDVCALVNACCDSSRSSDCGPYTPPAPQSCQDVEQTWILAICYDEKPSRGVTPLRDSGSRACCSRCNCGGSSTCGCGCHNPQPARTPARASTRAAAPSCEPTVICEGYRFTVFQTTSSFTTGTSGLSTGSGFTTALTPASTGLQQGGLGQSFLDCLMDLATLAANIKPPTSGSVQDLFNWCCALRGAFQDFLAGHGGTACSLNDVLNSFQCPDPAQFGNDAVKYRSAIEAAIGQLSGVMMSYIFQCLCSALLPPVPPASGDNCVPIASITLRRKDCRIIRICNLERKFAVTFPALGYWLSPLDALVQRFRQGLERLCCADNLVRTPVPVRVQQVDHAAVLRSASFVSPVGDESANVLPRVAQAWARRKTVQDPRAMMLDALGLAKADGSAYLTPLDRVNPAQSLLLDQLLVPFLSGLVDSGSTGTTGGETPAPAPAPQPGPVTPVQPVPPVSVGPVKPAAVTPAAASRAESAAFKARLDALAETVEKQQALIDELQKRLRKK